MLKSKNAWRQRGNLLLYLPIRPVKPQPCSPDWQEASFVISKMYAWPCNAVIFDLAIKNESYLALKCGMNQPCPSLFIALVHLWKHDLVTSIYSLISALCFITSTFGANISTPPGRGHSGWSLRGPQRHHCQCTCGRFLFLSALSHNSISISIWIDIAFYI